MPVKLKVDWHFFTLDFLFELNACHHFSLYGLSDIRTDGGI